MILKKDFFPLKSMEIADIEKVIGLEKLPMMIHKYNSALRNISSVLESIDEEFKVLNARNPIHHMESRIKSIKSICNKLERKNLPKDIGVADENITDIAGVRVICNYIDDVYDMVSRLKKYYNDDILKTSDYIKEPKGNGYRSYHMVIKLPVFYNGRIERVAVEIQLRTVAMDMWASLEHELRYKKEKETEKDMLIREKLRICSLTMKLVDESMQEIFKEIKNTEEINRNK